MMMKFHMVGAKFSPFVCDRSLSEVKLLPSYYILVDAVDQRKRQKPGHFNREFSNMCRTSPIFQ